MSTNTAQLIAVTGASGFSRRRHCQGSCRHRDTAFVGLTRSRLAKPPQEGDPDELVVGDINDAAVAAELTRGATAVIHTVSNFRALNDPPEAYRLVNVEGDPEYCDRGREFRRHTICSLFNDRSPWRCRIRSHQ